MRRQTRALRIGIALGVLLCLPAVATAGHMALVLTDVTGGDAQGKGALVHGWLILKLTGLPPQTELIVEVVESSGTAPRRLGRLVTTSSGRARLTVGLKDAVISPGTLILVRRVVEETPGEVVLEGRVR